MLDLESRARTSAAKPAPISNHQRCSPALATSSRYTSRNPIAVRATMGERSRGVARGAQVRTAIWRPPNTIRNTRKVRPVCTSTPPPRAKLTRVTPNAARKDAATIRAASVLRVISSVESVDDDDCDVVDTAGFVGHLDQFPSHVIDGAPIHGCGDSVVGNHLVQSV